MDGDYFSSHPPASSPSTPSGRSSPGSAAPSPRRRTILSPNSLQPVLTKEPSLPPAILTRFLHGGPSLNSLTAPSSLVVGPAGAATTSWRVFTDEEEARLQKGWEVLSPELKEKALKGGGGGSAGVRVAWTEDSVGTIPVGLDSLFSVSLTTLQLSPAFWGGASIPVTLSTWFYPSPATNSTLPSHQGVYYAVDPFLEDALEDAFRTIRPWEPSYQEELETALKNGAEGTKQIKVDLKGMNGLKVIFKDAHEARLYSGGLGEVGATAGLWWGGSKGLSGGQRVLRGWDRVRSDGADASATSAVEERAGILSGVFGGGGAAVLDENETEEALDSLRDLGLEKGKSKGGEDDDGVGHVSELVLVIHGIGQKLAGTYSSFDFVHAVNSLRNTCTAMSSAPDSGVGKLLHRKRAQFLPVRWRTELEFDEVDGRGDKEEEELGNSFTLEDIEIKDSVPFIRQVVSGLVLDVPFYLSRHKDKMVQAVINEANKSYRLFVARNPTFLANGGTVSIVAHSLGSVLAADILSAQPTFVKGHQISDDHFAFDTRTLFLVGSPLAFFLHLGKGQLIARRGRERAKGVGPDIALDRPGRYGCLAVDSIYNVYHKTDPVAFALNATVDVAYSKLIQPIAIPSTNKTLMNNLTETYNRVSRIFSVPSLWGSGSTPSKDDKSSSSAPPSSLQTPPRPRAGMKRMPSERPMQQEQFEKVTRAEKRMKALNPQGCIDYYLPAEGVNQYIESLTSHGTYWFDDRFATFILTQLFSSGEDLERTGREEVGSSD